MGAFGWEVIGSVAGVIAAAGAVVFGFMPLWQNWRKTRQPEASKPPGIDLRGSRGVQVGIGSQQFNQYIQTYIESPVRADSRLAVSVIVGEIPQAPPAFQPRADLLAALEAHGPGVVLVHALTGMRGVGKTQVAAAHARSRIDAHWRLVAWVNAADPVGVLAGLSEVAARFRLGEPGGSLELAARAVRHWLEAGGDRCLVVFDNVTDLDYLSLFLPAVGGSQVILTSNQVQAAFFGSAVPVGVFSEEQGLTLLAQRTGLADQSGARELGAELGWLPLGLAQAGAVIAKDHLDYPAYLARLRAHPAQKYLSRAKGEPYPHGARRRRSPWRWTHLLAATRPVCAAR